MNTAKNYRLYYNRTDDAPVLWCIDEGTVNTQIRIQWYLSNVPVSTGSEVKGVRKTNGNFPLTVKPKHRNPNEPNGWNEAYGIAVFGNGGVTIELPRETA